MKLEHYLKRVEEAPEFRKFKSKNPKAYLCAGFFILDFETGKNMHQIDYLLPNKKIATFTLDEGVKFQISKMPKNVKGNLKEIRSNAKLDLDMLKGSVQDEMKNKIVTEKIKKIIAVLQVLDKKLIWNLTCFLDGLGILQVHIDDEDGSILKFEKYSILDFVRHMPSITQNQSVTEESQGAAEKTGQEVPLQIQQKEPQPQKSKQPVISKAAKIFKKSKR